MVMVDIRDIGTRLEKFKPVGKRPYVRSVLILKTMGYEGVNISRELTESEDHVLT